MPAVRSRVLLWYVPALLGCGAAVLFAAGFWTGLKGSSGRPLGNPAPPPVTPHALAAPAGRRLLLVLGDSLARGTGDESGRGFVVDVLDYLRQSGNTEIANLAVNGAESSDVRDVVERPNVRTLAASASIILLSAGGNDLSHVIPRAGEAATPAVIEAVKQARNRYTANLRAILTRLREANPTAPIRVLGIYDPFEVDNALARAGASVILGWNALLQETALSFQDVLVVPTFDLFAGRPERLALDRFHPNREGYAAIAVRIEQLLPTSTSLQLAR
jgi:lysophospholipase L1-like esterase